MTIDDIEDLAKNLPNGGAPKSYDFKIRLNPRFCKQDLENDETDADSYRNYLPGRYSIYVRTWGCTHNSSDSEYMAGLLAAAGYRVVDRAEKADLWILNSCTVKNPAEDHFRNEISKAKKQNKKLIIAGCVPQSDNRSKYLANISVIGVQQIDKVVQAVEETLKGNVVRYAGMRKEGKRKAGGASLHLPKIRRNPLIEIIPINTGCLNACTYCKTKHARGDLGSYRVEDIVYRAETAFAEGVKELWITSEDTGAYGRDIGTNLPELLYNLVQIIPDDCMLRLGMTNPPYIYEHLQSMADILNHPRVYSFLHIPVQSGSDEVLQDMKREYCVEDFLFIVRYLREKVEGITIATDIICGFPTETEEDFTKTYQMINLYEFPVLFINQFYPRPGTPAAKMKRIDPKEVKRRTKEISHLFELIEPYRDRIGERYRILITEESTDKRYYVGHNKCYEQILVSRDSNCDFGDWLDIEVIECGKHHMIGRPLSSPVIVKRKKSNNKIGNIFLSVCVIVLASSLLLKAYRRL